jgi:NADPH-dependent 2,4-dienoyl-CoA reductase/sulfur reductase-like enzyme
LRESVFPIESDGLLPDEAVEICKYLVPFGLDAISVSGGVYETMNTSWEPTSYPEGWKLYLAEKIKKAVDVPVFGVGVIRNPDFAEKAIADGVVDCVVIARGQLADPDWVNKAKSGHPEDIRRCISCLNCFETLETSSFTGEPVTCAINARSGREWFYNGLRYDGNDRKVVIVGGGPSGCEAARVLTERGFNVTLFEKSDRLGGSLNLADKPPHKDKIDWLIEWYETQLGKLGVDVRLGTPYDLETVKSLDPYAVFVGTGSIPVVPRSIPGADGENVSTSADVLSGKVRFTGQNAVVIGSGMTGLETAELLGTLGNSVSVVEMADKIGPDAHWQNLTDIQVRLEKLNTRFLPSPKLLSINSDSVTLEKSNKSQFDLHVDKVVLSLGVRAPQEAAEELKANFERVITIGDTRGIGRIANAVHTAFASAYQLD